MDLERYIKLGLDEDIQGGDITSLACIPSKSRSRAFLKIKEVGVIAGVELAEKIFKAVDPQMEFKTLIKDGSYVHPDQIAFEVSGRSRDILKAERLVLNAMQRMSGIATLSARFAAEVEGLNVKLLDTRKTTPLNRMVEKWAVRIGGCYNYREGLYDWFMIKDNHIEANGSITKAIKAVCVYKEKHNLQNLGVTVEVRNLVELEEVLSVGQVKRIMLDNFELALLAEGVAMVNKKHETEASGGVSLETVRKIAQTGVDFISVGALTHSAGSLDLSLKIQ